MNKHQSKQQPKPYKPQQQKAEVFVSAGRKAYAMEIPRTKDTPAVKMVCIYSDERQRNLWLTGYRTAEREAGYRRATTPRSQED